MLEQIIKLDTELFLAINGWHSNFFDPIMWYISKTGTWFPLYAAYIIFLIVKFKKQAVWMILITAIAVGAADLLSVHLFKDVFERLRPCHNPEIKDLVHLVNGKCGGKYGFVSSHAANTFAFATISSFLIRNKTYAIFIFIWCTVVSYSRMYLGVHYPADVVCGALLGFVTAMAALKIFNYFIPKYINKTQNNS